jgi:hypothetical protein
VLLLLLQRRRETKSCCRRRAVAKVDVNVALLRDPIRLNRPPEGKNFLSYCARFPPPDSPPPVNATQRSSLGFYYTLTLHAFNRLTARRRSDAFANRRSSSACAFPTAPAKQKHADVIRPSPMKSVAEIVLNELSKNRA